MQLPSVMVGNCCRRINEAGGAIRNVGISMVVLWPKLCLRTLTWKSSVGSEWINPPSGNKPLWRFLWQTLSPQVILRPSRGALRN